jgi:hypothetical protein
MKVIILFINLLFVLSGCKEKPTAPLIDDLQPGRRDYTWTADTLYAEDYFSIAAMWGSSANNIWAVAIGTSTKDCLWHYDGNKWTVSEQRLSSALSSIIGFSQDDIWAADSYGNIWRYNGIRWYKFKEIKLNGYDRIVLSHFIGNSPTDLLLVGFADKYDGSDYKGIILKYNGEDWNFLNIDYIKVGFQVIVKASEGLYILHALNVDNGFLNKLFTFDGTTVNEIHSDYYTPILCQINKEAYISLHQKIYKYRNNKFELWKDLSGTIFSRSIFGRHEKDFFLYGDDGKSNIMHYNGTDIKILFSSDYWFYSYAVFEKDVFVFGEHPETRSKIMIRGTLKE